MNFFIIKNHQQAGPFTMEELRAQGITSETLVWREGMTDWTPAWQVEELRALLLQQQGAATPPPFTPNQPAANASAAPQEAMTGAKSQAFTTQPVQKHLHIARWIGGIVVFLLFLLILTNPNKRNHQDAIRDSVATYVNEKTTNEDNDLFSIGLRMMTKMLTGSVLDVLSNSLDYHNYLLFSKTTIYWDGRDHTVSYGFLGKIITLNSDDIAKFLESKEQKQLKIQGPTANDEPTTDDDIADKGTDKIVNSIGKMVKDKVEEETDSATGSDLQKIIDGVLGLFK